MNRVRGVARDSYDLIYRKTVGDDLLQDKIFDPNTIKRGLDILSHMGAGELAYSPEISHKFEEVLERRYAVDDGGDTFQMPHYGVYEDESMAKFYGVDTSQLNFRTEKESQQDTIERLLKASAKETLNDLPGLVQMMNWYAIEEWPRYGVQDDVPLVQPNSDLTMFRNPSHGWSTIDRGISTNDKHNIIQFYAGPNEPEIGGNVVEQLYPNPNPAWLIDSNDRNPL